VLEQARAPGLVQVLEQAHEPVLESSPGPESGREPGLAQVLGFVRVPLVWLVAAWLWA